MWKYDYNNMHKIFSLCPQCDLWIVPSRCYLVTSNQNVECLLNVRDIPWDNDG